MKHIKLFICSVLIVVLVIACFFGVRKFDYSTGKDNGYIAGYSLGYDDFHNNTLHNSQNLATNANPYVFGGCKWSGFMMGFPEGYEAAQAQGE